MPDHNGVARNVLVSSQKPGDLVRRLALDLPAGEGRGEEGLLQTIHDILENSVNTWDQGFMDKLYASTNPVSTVARLRGRAILTLLSRWALSPSYC